MRHSERSEWSNQTPDRAPPNGGGASRGALSSAREDDDGGFCSAIRAERAQRVEQSNKRVLVHTGRVVDNVTNVPSAPRGGVIRPRTRHQIGLAELLGGPAALSDPVVSGIAIDSRLVRPGDLYVALSGAHHHGAEFARQAVEAGAVAVLTDAAGRRLTHGLSLPVVVIDRPRQAMAGVAATIYGRPADALTMCAVTGTNGKTTTTFLLEAALRAGGVRTGLVGTVGFRLNGEALDCVPTTVTTPESTDLQGLLAFLLEEGAETVVMEVSSHALVLGRAEAITFDVAAFTNLGRDHLDFHGDMESYFEAKASLFTPERTRHAVINVDDPRGRELVQRIGAKSGIRLTTVSLDGDAACRALAYQVQADGRTAVSADLRGRTLDFSLNLPGDFNIRNALTALAMVDAIGSDLERAAIGLGQAQVAGRMERVELGSDAPLVYVDFAHTPQAVAAALHAVGTRRRRIVVLGCGGDRDPLKRVPMGESAARHADVVIATDDNPRSEDPSAVREQLIIGARAAVRRDGLATEVVDGGDRRSAIRLALQLARPGDVIAILGKGHELGQEVAGTVLPFSDPTVAAEEWAVLHPDLARQAGEQGTTL
jgi:UDP-N-acetylmuramoyl-L-alanyl-D-glutamate--2,6-diaminopimelate ligase